MRVKYLRGYALLFDNHPKIDLKSLYGRDKQINKIVQHLLNGRWVTLVGPRLVGKTSLCRVAQTELKNKGHNSLFICLWGYSSLREFLDALLIAIREDRRLFRRVGRLFSSIKGLKVGPVTLTLTERAKPVSIASQIFAILGTCGGELTVFVDEVQELHAVTGQLNGLLGNIFTTYPNVTFCFTGSQSGLVHVLDSPGDNSPLYGRSPEILQISPFDEISAMEYLKAGFAEHEISPDQSNLKEVIERFGRIPGWLTQYGYSVAVSGKSHLEAMKYCEKEAFKVTRMTLEHFLEGKDRRNYIAALKAMTLCSSWSEIRGAMEIYTGKRINDGSVKNVIDASINAYLTEKSNGGYRIIDPVLSRFLLGLK